MTGARLVYLEARRAAGSLVVVILAAVVTVVSTVSMWGRMTVWPTVGADIAVSLSATGLAGMLVASTAILRQARPELAAMLDCSSITPGGRRFQVICGATAGVGLIAAGSLGIQVAAGSLGSISIGSFPTADLVSGVATAMVYTALGGALACFFRSAIAAPVAAAVLFLAFFIAPDWWLLPVVPDEGLFVLPPRPPGWHALYVLALLAVVLCSLTPALMGRVAGTAGIAAMVVMVVVFGALTLGSSARQELEALGDPHRQDDVPRTAAASVCVHRSVRMCFNPQFASWVGLWQAAVAPIAIRIPPMVRAGLPTIRQEAPLGLVDQNVPPYIGVPVTWGRHGADVNDRRRLAGSVAAAAVGLPFGQHRAGPVGCDGTGQARTIVALWLEAATVEPGQLQRVRRTIFDQHGRTQEVTYWTSDLGAISYSTEDQRLAVALSRTAGVAPLVWAHWTELVNPSTTNTRLSEILGVWSDPGSLATGGNRCP